MNQQSTALNWTVLLLSVALTLCTLIIDDSVLILNLGLSAGLLSGLKLVAFLLLLSWPVTMGIRLTRNLKTSNHVQNQN